MFSSLYILEALLLAKRKVAVRFLSGFAIG